MKKPHILKEIQIHFISVDKTLTYLSFVPHELQKLLEGKFCSGTVV